MKLFLKITFGKVNPPFYFSILIVGDQLPFRSIFQDCFFKEFQSSKIVLYICIDLKHICPIRQPGDWNHPDKVATLGLEVQKAAAEKFRQVQEAYETIKRERGL